MPTECTRCGGQTYIRIPTVDPLNDVLHWCPDCSHTVPGRLDAAGEWTRTPRPGPKAKETAKPRVRSRQRVG